LCLDEVQCYTYVLEALFLGFADADETDTAALQTVAQEKDAAQFGLEVLADVLQSAHVEECFVLDVSQPLALDVGNLHHVPFVVLHHFFMVTPFSAGFGTKDVAGRVGIDVAVQEEFIEGVDA